MNPVALIGNLVWCILLCALGVWFTSFESLWLKIPGYVIALFFFIGIITSIKTGFSAIKVARRMENDTDGFVASFLDFYKAGGASEGEKAAIGIQIFEIEKAKVMKSRPYLDESGAGEEAAQNVKSKYPDLYPKVGE